MYGIVFCYLIATNSNLLCCLCEARVQCYIICHIQLLSHNSYLQLSYVFQYWGVLLDILVVQGSLIKLSFIHDFYSGSVLR